MVVVQQLNKFTLMELGRPETSMLDSEKLECSSDYQIEFEDIVNKHYKKIYYMALSMAKNEPDAADLTQETFRKWAVKHSTIKDSSKVKSWLYTTLYRNFIDKKRDENRMRAIEPEELHNQMPTHNPNHAERIDSKIIRETLLSMEEHFRLPLSLFYLEDYSYKEISDVLKIPIGTVMSRLSRGKEILHRKLSVKFDTF